MTTNLIDVKYHDSDIDHSRKDNPPVPPISVVQELIWIAFCIFKGSYMVSSLIESKNSVIRHVMPDRGMRTKAHLRNHLAPRLALHSENPMVELSVNNFVHVRCPIRNSLGFNNLDKFFTSNIEDLRVLKAEGGD